MQGVTVNLIDTPGHVRRDISALLTPDTVCLQDASGVGSRELLITPRSFDEGTLREECIACSDALLERFLNDEPITADECRSALIQATRDGRCHPVLIGVALHDTGVTDMLPAIVTYFQGKGDPAAALSALVYKVEWIEHSHKR
ncbi:hypothetical protein FACS1894184_20460 [Clostridia bacterium]|nr:hypothetical protein FACS1894184_20460 [Clostridia bacterium]